MKTSSESWLIGSAAFALVAICNASVGAQPADCPREQTPGGGIPLQLDIAGQPGVPPRVTGQTFVEVQGAPGLDCAEPNPAPGSVLRGEPGDVLRGAPSRDLLRGSVPRVRVERRVQE